MALVKAVSGSEGRMADNAATVAVWPDGLRVMQVRFARPTNALELAVPFYRDCLGLVELYRFEDHAGYHGVMLGLPGTTYHLASIHRSAVAMGLIESCLVLGPGFGPESGRWCEPRSWWG